MQSGSADLLRIDAADIADPAERAHRVVSSPEPPPGLAIPDGCGWLAGEIEQGASEHRKPELARCGMSGIYRLG